MITIMLISVVPSIAVNDELVKLQGILNSYHFIYKPELDIFDCVDMSIANYKLLQNLGYTMGIAIIEDKPMPDGQPNGHCIAIVKLTDGWVGIETKQAVINTSSCIGKVISIANIREICSTPEEIYQKDRRKNVVITGESIEKN